jgi:hypothetical protein
MGDDRMSEQLESMPADMPELPAELVAQPVEPMMAGTFALYATPDGGLMLVTETPEHGVVRRGVPGSMVKMATKLAEGGGGPMGALFRKMMGG